MNTTTPRADEIIKTIVGNVIHHWTKPSRHTDGYTPQFEQRVMSSLGTRELEAIRQLERDCFPEAAKARADEEAAYIRGKEAERKRLRFHLGLEG
jgi:hypothetical protein